MIYYERQILGYLFSKYEQITPVDFLESNNTPLSYLSHYHILSSIYFLSQPAVLRFTSSMVLFFFSGLPLTGPSV